MRVHVVCRLNQARSVIAAGALRQLFPDFEFFSSGIQAQSGKPIPQIISEIAHRWNIEGIDHFSMQFGEREEIRSGDLILAADSEIFEYLSPMSIPGKLLDVSTFSLSEFFSPEDPVNMSFESTQSELAKMILASSRAVELNFNINPDNQISALLSLNDKKSLLRVLKKGNQKRIIIDMQLSVPDPIFWISNGFKVLQFNHRQIDNEDNKLVSTQEATVLVSRFEVENPIALLLSKKWRAFLDSLSSQLPVTLVIRPMNPLGDIDPEATLAMLHSSALELSNS